MRCLKKSLGTSKVLALGMLVWGYILTSGFGLLHAQQAADLPPNPVSNTSSESISAASSDNASAPASDTLTFSERLRIYERSFISPQSLMGPALGAGISQLDNTPPEWGQGAEGYGRRFASGYGRSVISRTIEFGVAAADREDTLVSSHQTKAGYGDVRGTPSWEPLFLALTAASRYPPSHASQE